jgi:hypothetical protein
LWVLDGTVRGFVSEIALEPPTVAPSAVEPRSPFCVFARRYGWVLTAVGLVAVSTVLPELGEDATGL